MKTECINNTNFQGKLIVTNQLSNKPSKCFNKVRGDIEALIEKKDYNLFLKQDYDKQKIFFREISVNVQESIPITANSSKYIEAAKNIIEKYDKALLDKEQKEWERKQHEQAITELKDTAWSIVLFPLFIVEYMLSEINTKWSKNFEKFIDKLI